MTDATHKPATLFWACLLLAFTACSNGTNTPNTASPGSPSSANPDSQVESAAPDTMATFFTSFSDSAAAGANVYVPVYSHIYQHSRTKTFNLTTTLSIRNTDMSRNIRILKVYYYDSQGNLVERFLDGPLTLGPLSSTSYVVEEEDLRGGVGANFLVLWEATQPVNRPVIEAVMISTSQQQGISLISPGRELQRIPADE